MSRCEARTVDPCNGGRTYWRRCIQRGEVVDDKGLVLCGIHRRRHDNGKEIVPCFVDCGPACVCPPREVVR